MTIAYSNSKFKKQCSDATEMKRAFGQLAGKMSERLDDIIASPTLAVLMQLPEPNCHALKGKRTGQWALKLSGNYRLIFELFHNPIPMKNETEIDCTQVTDILLIEIVDYH